MLRRFAKPHPMWSWKMAHEILLREGWNINKEPTQRLWRDEGLRSHTAAPSAVGSVSTPPSATGPSTQPRCGPSTSSSRISDYPRLKLLNIVDEFTRQSLTMEVDRSITADRLVDPIESLVVVHRAPEHPRMDNGPSSARGHCGAGVGSPGPARSTSSRAHPGRIVQRVGS